MKKASDSTEDLSELFSFYKETVKPLYAVIQVDGSLPSEVLFEINAALDHVSRVFTGDQGADRAIDCARGHLKRSCLDIFKLAVKSAHDQYDELNHDKGLAYLDNGDFQSKMRQSWEEIKSAGIEARKCEI
ncbi:MAG: hypothetical protein KAH38_01740, partial [Candidatus Hydrogenedentes bacterium]|nr:hypothetical protein [Candidatus Hydrogenedentota bacterium]